MVFATNTAIVHEKMNVLVLDTSTDRAAIGLGLRSGMVLRHRQPMGCKNTVAT